MSKFLKHVIDWPKVDQIIIDIINYFEEIKRNKPEGYVDPTPTIERFVNWYQQKRGSNQSILDRDMQAWIIAGIPRVESVVKLLQREINRNEQTIRSNRFKGSTRANFLNKPLYQENYQLSQKISQFLGCQNDLGEWFKGLLDFLAREVLEDEEKYYQKQSQKFAQACSRVETEMSANKILAQP